MKLVVIIGAFLRLYFCLRLMYELSWLGNILMLLAMGPSGVHTTLLGAVFSLLCMSRRLAMLIRLDAVFGLLSLYV